MEIFCKVRGNQSFLGLVFLCLYFLFLINPNKY